MPSQWGSSIFIQGGLEIPCALKFVVVNRKEATKTKSLLESALNIQDTINFTVSQADKEETSCSTGNNVTNGEARVEKAAEDYSMDMTIDLTASTNSPPSKKQKLFDAENIIMGVELTDAEINYGQRLLKEKYPKINGLHTTLYQGIVQEVENSIQVIHCPSRFTG